MKTRIALLWLALALLAAACSEPVPQARAAYVGTWRADNMLLDIRADGHIHYEKRGEHGKTTVDAPIQRFEGDNFVVGLGPFNTTFVVSKPPHVDDGKWKMTVDGVDLVRTSGPVDTNV